MAEPAEPGATSHGDPVVLVVAHGSRNPDAEAEHRRLCDELDARTAAAVRPAFLEITEPNVTAAIDAAVTGGANAIVVLPYFLSSGNHVQVDLPRLIQAARSRHRSVALHLEPHLGADPALVDLLRAQIDGTQIDGTQIDSAQIDGSQIDRARTGTADTETAQTE